MPSLISTIETLARQRLEELSPRFWTSPELVDIISAGIRDLWRDVVDLKQEHYLTVNNTDVYLGFNSSTLSGVPADVHKVYLIEPRDVSENGINRRIQFIPRDYNHRDFQMARSCPNMEPTAGTIYYAIMGQGAPVNAPVIRVAPGITRNLNVSFCYVPTLGQLFSHSTVPIPGEADNALVAWTVAFARAKEKDDRSPDPNWLAIYATEKQHLLQSLGLRQYQEPSYVDALFAEYW